jgi:hypothetical protein
MVAPLIVRGLPLALRGAKELASKAKRYGGPGWSAMAALDALTGGSDEKKKREQSDMTSTKNANAGTGRGTSYYGPAESAPKKTEKRTSSPKKTANAPKTTTNIPVSPIVETAGIRGLPGSPSGVSEEREAASGKTTFFGPTPEDAASMVAQTPRMREGLFGEEIPEDVYQEMERKNKEAGFYSRFKKGGSVKKKPVKKYASGGSVSSASKRADGCATKGKTRGRMV